MNTIRYVVALTSLLLFAACARAADNPLIGKWLAKDPSGSGESIIFTFTASHLQMAGEEALPYRIEQAGDNFALYIDGPRPSPASTVTILSDDTISLAFPGNPTITMTKVAEQPATSTAAPPAAIAKTLADEFTTALLPHGVATKFEPIGQSLEQLLTSGWKMVQISAAQGGFSIWLTNGSTNTLCILVPKLFDEAGGALSDCRRLN